MDGSYIAFADVNDEPLFAHQHLGLGAAMMLLARIGLDLRRCHSNTGGVHDRKASCLVLECHCSDDLGHAVHAPSHRYRVNAHEGFQASKCQVLTDLHHHHHHHRHFTGAADEGPAASGRLHPSVHLISEGINPQMCVQTECSRWYQLERDTPYRIHHTAACNERIGFGSD